MTPPTLQGKRIELRPIEPADLDELHRIVSTPEVGRWWNPCTRGRGELSG